MTITKQSNQKLLAATFLLGQAAFGVDTAQIQEVVRLGNLTPVHHAPAYVVGIRNLRGRIVTVIDLRTRLELGRVATGPESRILIVEAQGEPIGLLVDQVADTIDINTADIHPAPPNVNGVQSRHLRGVCRNGARLVALLDLAAVLQTATEPSQVVVRELAPA
jgi:purine-binding chemotaxis protein CheW